MLYEVSTLYGAAMSYGAGTLYGAAISAKVVSVLGMDNESSSRGCGGEEKDSELVILDICVLFCGRYMYIDVFSYLRNLKSNLKFKISLNQYF